MAELNCRLSALVFAELYRQLGTKKRTSGELQDRLYDLGYDLDWLDEAAEAYDAKWRFDAGYIDPDAAADFALPVEHSLLATWLLASLRNTGDSYDFSASLRGNVQQRMVQDAPSLSDFRPSSFSPIIRGWTLGMVIGSIDSELPIVPAHYPSDPHIAAAYQGLVEHVLHLADIVQPWPELTGSALYVRTGGLAEALRPPPPPPPYRGMGHSIDQLMSEARSQVPLHISERLRNNWIRWVDRRNVLTHVKPMDHASSTFIDSAEAVRTWEHVNLTVLGITQFVCQEVSQELRDSVPPALRSEPWEYLRREIQTEW